MERSKTGHAAGLRTTLLVTLAASVAMIQMNLLIPTNGKPSDSYAVMDMMRLPLGILTGVGFIGAGAIVRKGELVVGITTAATMWFATVVGLCLGGGQLILGMVAAALGFIVLFPVRRIENRIERYQSAELGVTIAEKDISFQHLRSRLEAARFGIQSISIKHLVNQQQKKIDFEIRWHAQSGSADIPQVLAELEGLPGLIELNWKTIGSA